MFESSTAFVVDIPQSAAERKSYILRKLLMQHHVVDIYQIATELCISPSTLDNELHSVKAELSKFGLSLRVRQNSLQVIGDASNEKKMISHLIYTETKDFFNQLELISNYFPKIDLQKLRKDIGMILARNDLTVNNYSLSNLILHVAILLERELNGFHGGSLSTGPSQRVAHARVLESVDEISARVLNRYGVLFSTDDRRSIAIILSASLIVHEPRSGEQLVDETSSRLVDSICRRVQESFSLDLSGDDFKIRFGMHIESMLKRDQLAMNLRNPQVGAIKNDYPFIYDISVFIADIVREETGISVSEDEIAFIALHIGCLIEEQAECENKLRALVVCSGADPSTARLIKRISKLFSSHLTIKRLIENPDELESQCRTHEPVNIVLTTQPLYSHADVPVVQISPFLGDGDAARIASRIDEIRDQRFQASISTNLHMFFRRDLFFCRLPITQRDEALEFLAGRLSEKGHVMPSFKKELFDREQISSSAYRSVAVPHPLSMHARKTAVAILCSPEGIEWNGSTVNMVMMLAIRKEDAALYRVLFTYISKVLIKSDCTRALARTTTFDEFVELMLHFTDTR